MIPETQFTPGTALLGGVLIGASTVFLMASLGRIAGISGILGLALKKNSPDRGWRLMFLLGLLLPGLALTLVPQARPDIDFAAGPVALAVSGFIVAMGTRLANGCTSGHGVCGLSRLSIRSAVMIGTTIIVGMLTTYLFYHVMMGGAA